MSYINFDYYKNTYKGFKVPLEKFEYYSERASEKLDYYLNVDIQTVLDAGDYVSEIKKACSGVCDALHTHENKKTLSGEKTLTYSVTYDISKNKSIEQMIYNIISNYLGETSLMFRGC